MSKKKTTKPVAIFENTDNEMIVEILPAPGVQNEVETPEVQTVEIAPNVVAEVKKKPGRPVVENSTRQIRLAARAARAQATGEVKRGRPANPNSARQAKMTARVNVLMNGGVIKRGRPKVEKTESVAAEA
jgi:hypothetical protein